MNKAGSITKKLKRQSGLESGLTTMEIMIAMFIFVLTISAVIMVLFGGQSTEIDTETNQEALYFAQEELENTRAQSRGTVGEFNSIISTTPTTTDIYTKTLEVLDISPCVKEIKSTIDWDVENRPQSISISSIIGSLKAFIDAGSNCSIISPSNDNWRNPVTNHDNIIINTVNGESIAVLNKIVYLGVYDSNENLDDLFIYDAANTSNPVFLGSIGVDWGPGKKLNGIVDLVAVDFQSLNKRYIFAASIHGDFYDPDDGSGSGNEKASGQLQVIDVTDPAAPIQIASVSLPGVSGTCNFTCPGGRSIAYYNNRIYIGTHRVGGSEFHIFDVTDPTNPVHLGNTGSTQVDHNINDIEVREDRAYLATSSNNEEIIVLNIANPLNITIAGTFDAERADGSASSKDGRDLYVIGNKIYLGIGRSNPGNDRDFYVVDTNDLSSAPGSVNFNDFFNYNQGAGITGIKVSGQLAFVTTRDPNDPFLVLDVSDPANIERWDTCPYNFSVDPQNFAYENDVIYTVTNQQSKLRIIEPSPVCN